MHRIDSANVDPNEFGTGKAGFTAGDPEHGISPTDLNPDWLDSVQEEISGVVEGEGATLVKGTNTQLAAAITQFVHRTADAIALMNAKRYLSSVGNDYRGLAKFTGAPVVIVGGSGGAGSIQTFDGFTLTSHTPDNSFVGIFYDVCAYSGGLFVAVGSAGEIQKSNDGATWAHQAADSAYAGAFHSVACQAGVELFVAVGSGGEIQTSTNATTWTHRTADASYSGTFYRVFWSVTLGKFVAVGTGSEIQTSSDGTTWSHKTNATFTGTFMGGCDAVINGVAGVVIVGATAGGVNEVQTSTNGTTWAHRTCPSAGAYGVYWVVQTGVAYGSNFLVVAGGAEVVYSIDGCVTWHSLGATGLTYAAMLYPNTMGTGKARIAIASGSVAYPVAQGVFLLTEVVGAWA